MEIKEVVIKLSEETLRELEKSAKAAGKEPGEIAADLVTRSINPGSSKPTVQSFPSVALMRENAILPSESRVPQQNLLFPGHPGIINQPSPEKQQRRKELEAQMRELSLLIDTATEDKKETYSLQYAILAAELEATL